MEALREMMNGLVEAAERPEAPTHEIGDMAQFIVAAAQRATADQLTELARGLAPVVDIDSPHAPVTFVLGGALVEHGADPEPLADAILRPLAQALALSASFLDAIEADGELTAERWAEIERPHAWHVVELIWRPAVAVLGRSAELRDRYATLAMAADRLAPFTPAGDWLGRILRVVDEARFSILHEDSGRTFDATVSGVMSVFELHTHLVVELIGDPAEGWLDGTPASPAVVANVRGEGPQVCEEEVAERWRMFTTVDGEERELLGNDEVASIPEDEDDELRRIVLRNSDSGATYPAHRSFATLTARVRAMPAD
ncbi:MAG: hypothetical protein RKU31_37150 [Deltaproteobacteria bacterium]|jgi:hypothetical protein